MMGGANLLEMMGGANLFPDNVQFKMLRNASCITLISSLTASIIVKVSHTTSFLVRSTQLRFSRVAHVSCGGSRDHSKASSRPGGPRATFFFAPALDIRQLLPYAAHLVFDVTRHGHCLVAGGT
jgi:hypothetical protein